MSNTIQIKRSSTAAAVPTAGQLAVGELAVNLADKKLFTKTSAGAVIDLSFTPGSLTTATPALDDFLPFSDTSDSANPKKATIQDVVKLGSNATGDAPTYACRAWVNFNGTGTVAIRASGNVSSITDINTGRFQINFTTAMPDANFAIAGTTRTSSANFNGYVSWEGTASVADTTFVKIATTNTAGAYIDGDYISVIVSR